MKTFAASFINGALFAAGISILHAQVTDPISWVLGAAILLAYTNGMILGGGE